MALDLFTEQGYDGTSLRQIAEQLGVTKAALYYHFESKEDILMALHMRLHDFGKDALVRIGEEPVTLALWEELLDEIVGEMLAQRKIFLMHERNQAALEKLHREDHDAEHEDIQNQFRRVLEDIRVPLRDRVRMAASFGVIFSSLFLAGDAFESTTNEELGEHAPRHPPRRPRRMTAPVPPGKNPARAGYSSSLVTDAPAATPTDAARAPLHDRHRRGRHRPQGRRARQGRQPRRRPGPGPHQVPDVVRRPGADADHAGRPSSPRATASRAASPAWSAAATC